MKIIDAILGRGRGQGPEGGVYPPKAPDSPDPMRVPIGETEAGERVDWEPGHLLGAGYVGTGMGVLLLTLLRHFSRHPEAWSAYLVDLRAVEFARLGGLPSVEGVALDLDAALELLRELRSELDRRHALLRDTGTKGVADLNRVLGGRGEEPLKRLVVIVDELAHLTDSSETGDRDEDGARSECRRLLDGIVRVGRVGGVHLVAASQRPDPLYLSGAVLSNIRTRAITGRMNRAAARVVGFELASELPTGIGGGVWLEDGEERIVRFYHTETDDLALERREE